ncbi:MAG: hypothetical protein M1818_007397 [Claussenomyces sp. TS43310]|nr:MAG: hypothetical protein M1818_007397 [Claussenomyces sp. TS43310]
MASTALRTPPQEFPIFSATPDSIISDTTRLIEHSRKAQNYIAENVKPDEATFANVLLPIVYAENDMAKEAHILGFYKFVSPDPKLRNASTEAQKLLDDFALQTAMREDLFRLVDSVLRKDEDLDPESRRLLLKCHKDYLRNGLLLPAGPKWDRFKEVKRRISQVTLEFRQNLVEENGDLWFSPEDLEGVPKDVLSRLTEGAGERTGRLRLTFKSDFYPAMRYAKKADTRKCIYIANDNKCKQNIPLFKEAMILRDEVARLLGYPDHATFRLEDKMAQRPEIVNAFLNDLRVGLAPGGLKEVEKLKQLKEADLASRGELFDGRFSSWDLSFYNRLMLETRYLVDQEKIKEYFPLQTTVRGMLEIFQHLFGLVFLEITDHKLANTEEGSNLVWLKDVQVLSVWDDDAQSEFVGYLYLDLSPREGKYGNAANFNLWPGFLRQNGTRQYPATALVCNFSEPTSKRPSLLIHREVVTLFHELGHCIHDLVSKTKYSRFHGTNTVIDFGEAPSQMLENWCWEPSVLKSLSRHYSSLSSEYLKSWEEQAEEKSGPPEKIPDEMIESLIRAKHVNVALSTLNQLHLSIFDMTVHEPESHEAIEKLNISARYNTLRKELSPIDGPEVSEGDEWGHGQANFGHLMGDYDAGYYGYLSSQVYSDDMFYTFFKEDPMNPREGRRYRYTVLEKGGRQDEMKTLIEFLGRKPRTEAFYQQLGLA